MPSTDLTRSLNVLLVVTDPVCFKPFFDNIAPLLSKLDTRHFRLRIIACRNNGTPELPPLPARFDFKTYTKDDEIKTLKQVDAREEQVNEYCSWADMLILAPMDAGSLARMLTGMTSNLHLQILRSWDVSKKIMLIPAMSGLMWENPMTKKHINKIRRKWTWVRVLPPLLWTFDAAGRQDVPWEGADSFLESIQSQVGFMAMERSVHQPGLRLPPELWSIILNFTGDWELATALNIHTTLPVPPEWRAAFNEPGPQTSMEKLEWALLTCPYTVIKGVLDAEKPTRLSQVCIDLIIRFAMVPVLRRLETHHNELFRTTFGGTYLPFQASAVFGKVKVLEFWRTCPTFVVKEYMCDAMDTASCVGFVHVLDWWFNSGLPLKYSEAALEKASSRGHIAVLEWWRQHGIHGDKSPNTSQAVDGNPPARPQLRLKVGKSISYATLSGSLRTLRWWFTSGIPFPHEDSVAKLASTHGYTHVLDYWHKVRGEKMLFDNQVLVGATKMGHADVLEWWKRSGLRVEYKTCDIEEALEDGVEGERGEQVRQWWVKNGINEVGTGEWMRTKILEN
ncbi:flavo protein [Delitschia confertaspora ATCC 74209]|uniref:Flavo protein n=1 Tax=Delitschia confertaspora ATCC 74209 TaxID=1513339 RepID=A0A9P4MRB3_9PLEO|nr:flavo protein [Delitschia confertaspora ATCC 74209]